MRNFTVIGSGHAPRWQGFSSTCASMVAVNRSEPIANALQVDGVLPIFPRSCPIIGCGGLIDWGIVNLFVFRELF